MISTIVNLHPLFSTTVSTAITQRVSASWPWYVIRAAGFVAAGLLVLLMLSGIGQVTGLTYRFVEPIKAWAIHKALAFALCISIAVHIGFLLIDHYLPFNIFQILIPFLSHYNNGTSIGGMALGTVAVAMGIFALYGVVLLVLSSLGWIDTKTKRWRKLHYTSYAVAGLVFLHAAYTGSDLKYGTFRAAWMALGLLVAAGIISRVWRAGTVKKQSVATPAIGGDLKSNRPR
jgi:hypothetical protein